MTSLKVLWIADPGHAWLAISHKQLTRLNLSEADLSEFSYLDPLRVYAEEDRDAGVIIRAAEKAGIELEFLEEEYFSGDAPVRRFSRCSGRV